MNSELVYSSIHSSILLMLDSLPGAPPHHGLGHTRSHTQARFLTGGAACSAPPQRVNPTPLLPAPGRLVSEASVCSPSSRGLSSVVLKGWLMWHQVKICLFVPGISVLLYFPCVCLCVLYGSCRPDTIIQMLETKRSAGLEKNEDSRQFFSLPLNHDCRHFLQK